MGTFAETVIASYCFRLPTKANKFLFSVSVFSKQTEVCHFPFPLAANKLNMPFTVSFVSVCWISETWRWRHGEWRHIETWRHGDSETWRHEAIEPLSHWAIEPLSHWAIEPLSHWAMDMETWRRKTEAQAIFLNPFIVCSFCKQKLAVCPFFDEETDGSYPFCKRT